MKLALNLTLNPNFTTETDPNGRFSSIMDPKEMENSCFILVSYLQTTELM